MSRSRAARTTSRKKRNRRQRRSRVAFLWPGARWRRRAFRALLAAPRVVQLVIVAIVVLALWSATNWAYQVVRKPTEMFFPVSSELSKTPTATWRQYEPIFQAHATTVITPELLAALAQVEGAGNPVARTYWRWRPTWDLFEVYRPASSAVGMYQITDATFAEAKRYCIHDHVVVEDGPWNELGSCWFNSLYSRVVPTHAVELTSAYLDRHVASILERRRIAGATLQQKQDLAVVIHLCGAGAGDAYARRGFRLTAGQRCGDHDLRGYLARVNAMKRVFTRLATIVRREE
jgi:Transglycosylase SLT domain